MCGIVGFVGPGNAPDLRVLTGLLAHRGPDSDGFFVDEHQGIFLGHRRLAIRDAAGGAQPMRSSDERFIIAYNGELYNDRQLRGELETQGHKFVSESDTEVVLHALIEWGTDALHRFDGQFALCFVNLESKDIILARDRFGEKPLFWSQQTNGIIFSSESNVLAQHPWVDAKLDEPACVLYLLLGYLPPPYSIIQGVRQVRPGYAVCFSVSNLSEVREFAFARPWENWQAQESSEVSEDTFGIEYIEDSLSSRRVSDEPTGLMLSGGIDSSLIAASAVRMKWYPPTFTLGFSDSSFDESAAASELAAQLGLENSVRMLGDLDDGRITSILETLDEPLGDSSYVPTYELFGLAAEHAKVLLTGDGGDELFFGYEPFRAFRVSRIASLILRPPIARLIGSALKRIPRSARYMNRIDVAERFLDGLMHPPLLRILVWMMTLRTTELKTFFEEEPKIESVFREILTVEAAEDDLSTIRRLFLNCYLPGSVFAKSDTAAMSHSVEARTVFLQPSIVRFALSRRGNDEITRRFGKQSLRRLVRGLGLTSIASRKKHGFASPIADIIIKSDIPAPRLDLSSIKQEAVDLAWSDLRAGSVRHAPFLWAILALVNSKAYKVATTGLHSR